MSQASPPSLDAILRECAAAAPQPWYHRAYARQSGADPEDVVEQLDLLWLEGLVQKVPGTAESGTGALLTPLGRQVLDDAALLDRLRRGLPVRPDDPGAVVRHSLRTPVAPIATHALIAANVALFLAGAWLAARPPGQLMVYLSGFPSTAAAVRQYVGLLHALGGVEAGDLARGQWWRLLTTTLVHGGILHLLLNMFTLAGAGSFVEQTWGRWRLLVIYALSAWGSSCLAMAYRPESSVVGASGAICGVLGAEAVWVLLYGKYLPAALARRGRSQVFSTLVLLILISALPRISGWCHLGGAVTGALAAVVLHWQRFGPRVVRWAALLLLVPLPLLSYGHLQLIRSGQRKADEPPGDVVRATWSRSGEPSRTGRRFL
jgi:membrane associated rhomboid family serine protease